MSHHKHDHEHCHHDHENNHDFFNESASTWDNHAHDMDFQNIEKILDRVPFSPDDQILDVGAGTGILVPFLIKRQLNNFTAIDSSEKMAAHYSKKYPGRKIVVGDYEQILFPKGSFDKIIIFNTFPHFAHPENAIKNSLHYLKKGGRLVIAHSMSRHELNKHHAKHAAVAHDVLVDAPTLTAMLEKAGFTHITIDDGAYYFALAQA